MLPAHQRLHASHLTRAQIDLGLVKQAHFIGQQRLAHAADAIVVTAGIAVQFGIKQVITVFALLLGHIHGLISMAQQCVGIGIILGEQGHAHAGTQVDGIGTHHHGLLQHIQHALARLQARLHGAHTGHEDDKLIAPHARNRVTGVQSRLQAMGHVHQHTVASLMAPVVIDGLEPVEVKVTDGQQGVHASGLLQRMSQLVGQQRAVGQLGQRVVIGQLGQLALLGFQAADVRKHRHVVGHGTGRVANGGNGQQLGKHLAKLVAVPDFSGPGAVVLDAVPHRFVKRLVVPPRSQHARVAPQHLGTRPPGDA